MGSQVVASNPGGTRRSALNQRRGHSTAKKPSASENGVGTYDSSRPTSPPTQSCEKTVKKLKLSKALTIPDSTSVFDACRRMASRRVNAVLLTDSNALLSGILTDKDIAIRVIAEGLRPDQTLVSKIMTRNPIFVNSDCLAIEAMQKMINGRFRHLPVVENGEVIALLDITRCLYDAIARVEKAAEHGSAIAAAVEGVERQWGSNFSAPAAFIEILRDRMFKPSLSTIMGDNTKCALASPSDPVYVAARKMRELRTSSVIIANGNRLLGILTSKDILMRAVAQNLSPELTLVEKVMTPNPECATLDTTILDALHMMHNGKFLHLPVLDKDGSIVGCVDVLQITNGAIAMVESSSGAANDVADTLMQKFWDSALALEPPDDCDAHSEMSGLLTSDGTEVGKHSYPSLSFGSSFTFKFVDPSSRVHRFNCGIESLEELLVSILQRAGMSYDRDRLQVLYEDDEGDKVVLSTDSDLIVAVNHARSLGLKVMRLYLDNSNSENQTATKLCNVPSKSSSWLSLRSGALASAVIITGIGVAIYLRRSKA